MNKVTKEYPPGRVDTYDVFQGVGGRALMHLRIYNRTLDHDHLMAAKDYIDGPFDGEEGITLLADLEAGATGTMTSALACEQIRPIVFDYLNGYRDKAEDQYQRLLPLINLENRQCGQSMQSNNEAGRRN